MPSPSKRGAPLDLDADLADGREPDGVVLAGEDGLAEVEADLGGVDVEGGDELDVADVVATEADVHEAGDGVGRVGVAVVLDALDEGAGTVADACDGDTNLLGHGVGPSWVAAGGPARLGRTAPPSGTGPVTGSGEPGNGMATGWTGADGAGMDGGRPAATGARWMAGARPGRAARPVSRSGDQTVEPGDVPLSGLVAVFEQAPGVGVEPLPPVANGVGGVGQALEQEGPATFEETQAGIAGKITGEGQPEVEYPLVVARGGLGGQQLLEQQLAPGVMP